MSNATSEMQRALAAVQDAWSKAGSPWNPDALAALYTSDALFFGGRAGHSVGREAVRSYFASYVGVIEQGRMVLADTHYLAIDSDCFLAQGYVDFAFTLSGGRETRSRLRATLLIVRTKDGWRIRQHHFSPTPDAPPLGDR